jgi:amidase
MKRRDFINTGAIAGITTLVTGSCKPKPVVSPATAETAKPLADFELNEESISSLQEKMKAGTYR